MHCNRHCYLMNKLKQTEEKEKKQERAEQKSCYHEFLPGKTLKIAFKFPVFKLIYPECFPQSTVKRSFGIFYPPRNI